MEEIEMQANRRKVVGKQVNSLRRAGQLPAILYGRQVGSMPIVLDLKEASRILERLSPSALIHLNIDGESHYVLVREKQRNVLLGTLQHVDFQAVSLTEKVRTNVTIHLTGESPAVDNFVGLLVQSLENVEIEALPRDLPERIEVDISGLEEIGDSILVSDLNLPANVEIHAEPDETVVVITAPVSEEVLEEEEEEEELPVGAEPEVIERGKHEEEEEE